MKIFITGPTGVGKTKLSIALAKYLDAYIINCDAVQVYKELNVGSAKVTEDEKEGIKHFLFDIKNPDEEYNVKDYQKDLRDLFAKYKDKNLIIVELDYMQQLVLMTIDFMKMKMTQIIAHIL